jgi:hypothetical protein
MNDAVRDALRIAKRPVKPVRFHHTVARKGYAEGGDPHAEGEVTFAPPQQQETAPTPVQQKEEESEPVPEQSVDVPVDEVTPVYQRLINPAGFYSRAHEVALNELPEGELAWPELRALMLNHPGLFEEEMVSSGLHPEAFDNERVLTRDDVAKIIEENFPKEQPYENAETASPEPGE